MTAGPGKKGVRAWGRRLGVAAFWLAAWQLASMAVGSRIVLVGPAEVARRLAELVLEADFWVSAGLSLAMGLSWKSGIAAEVIGLPAPSIGIHLYDAKVYLDTPDLLAWTVVIVALSVGLEALLGRLLDWAQTRWEARP